MSDNWETNPSQTCLRAALRPTVILSNVRDCKVETSSIDRDWVLIYEGVLPSTYCREPLQRLTSKYNKTLNPIPSSKRRAGLQPLVQSLSSAARVTKAIGSLSIAGLAMARV